MQLSEKRIMELARSIAGNDPWSIGCVKFARLLEEEIARALLTRASAATVAEPSEPWREKLIELADQLDAELTTGVQWSNAQFACFYVSDDLRKIVKKAGGVPNEKDWKTRALEAEKLNRQFIDRWNSENSPTHMGEPVIAAQQQAEPGADERAVSHIGTLEIGSDGEYNFWPNREEIRRVKPAFGHPSETHRLYRGAQSGQRAGVAEVRDELLDRIKTMCEGSIVKMGDAYALGAHNLAATILRMLAAAPTQQQEGS